MTDSRPLRILITDGDSRAALAATRSLGRKGHAVYVAGSARSTLAGASRHATAGVEYPDPIRHPQAFVSAIAQAVTALAIDVLIPMTEVTTLLLTRNRADLPAGCALPFAGADAIDAASDKARVLELATELDVPVPATQVALDPAGARNLAKGLVYPVVLKPARSRVPTGDGWLSTRVSHARDAGEFAARIGELPPEAYPVLVQERIAGDGVGIFACYQRGQPIAFFAHRRLREKPPSGGVSVLRESIALDPAVQLQARKLLDRLDWHGVAMVEFKRNDRDGSLRLMEINGRFWGSLQLANDAGIDFPSLLVAVAQGEAVPPASPYRPGVRSRWFLGDLDVLLTVLFRSRRALSLPAGYPSRMRLLWRFLHLWGRNLHYEVLTLEDPKPGFVEFGRWLSGR